MRLRTLFDDPELGLRLLAGRDELDREIRWVYTTDLRDPRRYLTGGELVLSGLMWREVPDDSDAFVAALAESGVAALVAGTARLGSTPRDLVNACRRRQVPLLELPVTVSFNSVSDRVILDVVAERSAPSRGRGPLVSAVADGADARDLARLVSSEWSTGCWIMSTMDRVVAEAGTPEELTGRDRRALVDSYLRTSRTPVHVEPESGSEAVTVFGLGNADEIRVADWFVGIPGAHDVDSAMVAELGTALALVRSRLDEGRRVAAQAVGTVLRLVTEGGGTQSEISAQLAALGHDTARPAWVVAAEVADDHALTERMLTELAAALGLPAITGRTDDEVFGVLGAPEDPAMTLAELRRRVQALEPALRRATVTMGVSAAVPVHALRGAVEEARHARLLARHRVDRTARSTDRSGSACVVDGSEIATHQLLLAAVPDTVQESFRLRLLRDLQDYDAEHQSDLVHTLAVFLETSCSWSRAASRLHVHVNTLRYRIKRVEEITGRDFGRFADRVDLFLALELG